MRLFRRPRPTPSLSSDRALQSAIDGYLGISRSPLRDAEPAWWDLAEAAAWERVRESLPCTAPARAALPAVPSAEVRPPSALDLLSGRGA